MKWSSFKKFIDDHPRRNLYITGHRYSVWQAFAAAVVALSRVFGSACVFVYSWSWTTPSGLLSLNGSEESNFTFLQHLPRNRQEVHHHA